MDDDSGDEPKKNRWGAAPGEAELHDLDFDFEAFFSRDVKDLSEADHAQWQGRIYGWYCSAFYKSGGDVSAIPKWVAAYVADRLFDGLQGAPWGDTMRLPWDEPTPTFTARGQRAFDTYAHVENGLRANPAANVTDLIAEASRMQSVSYETARAGYYKVKSCIKWKKPFPPNFLINEGDF